MAATATWAGPGAFWDIDANWSPAGVPTDAAIFTASGPTTILVSANTSINTVQFAPGAQAYSIHVLAGVTFDLNLLGIVDFSSNRPALANQGVVNFNAGTTAADANVTNTGMLNFKGSATAADADMTNTGGTISFTDTSSAGNAAIVTTGGTISFNGDSTAGHATIDNPFGTVSFEGASNAGNAVIDNVGSLFFRGTSTADNAAIMNGAFNIVDFSGTVGPSNDHRLSAGSISGGGQYFLGANELTVGNNGLATEITGTLADGGAAGGTGASLVKVGGSTLTLSGFSANTYTGQTSINGGTLLVNTSIAASSHVSVNGTGTLGGNGTVSAVGVAGTLAPGQDVSLGGGSGADPRVGTLHTGAILLVPGANFAVDIGPAFAAGPGDSDQLDVTGTVTIGDANLSVSFVNGFTPQIGDSFTIINNDGSDAVNGEFLRGNKITAGGHVFFVNYHGGDGNDVVLTAVNDAPTILGASNNAFPYVEQFVPLTIDSDLTLLDPNSGTLAGGTVTITSGYQSGDVLTVANPNGIAASYDAATHRLTLSGTATLAQYQAALRTVTFDNPTSDDPTNAGANPTRTIAWQADDGMPGNHLSNIATSTITITGVNDAPVNHVPGDLQARLDADLGIVGLSVSDPDAGAGTLITTLSVAHGTLAVAAVGGAVVSGSGSGSVTVAGTAAQIDAALAAGVVYRNFAGFHGSDTLTMQTDDGGHSGVSGPKADVDQLAITLSHALPLLPQGDGHYDADHSGAALMRRDDGLLLIEEVNNNQMTGHILGAIGTDWSFRSTGDFDRNGTSDLLWQHDSDGMLLIHTIDNNQVTGAAFLGAIGTDWKIHGTGDFNHDGTADLVWQHESDGMLLIHSLQNNQVIGASFIGAIGTDWTFLGTADFNNDGTSDLLWQQQGSGMLLIHNIQNNQVSGASFVGAIGSDWHFAGTGDFNGDHTADMLFQADDGTLRTYTLVNNQVAGSQVLEVLAPDMHVAGITDYTGDGTDDIVVRRDDGSFHLQVVHANTVAPAIALGQVGTEWLVV